MNRTDARSTSKPADAGVDATQIDAMSAIKMESLRAGSATITPQNSIACAQIENNVATAHRENHYYRTFTLNNLDITSDFIITSVDIGIDTAQASGGTQPITLILHTLNGTLSTANLTEIVRKEINVANQEGQILNVPIDATAPANSTLVVEVMTPDGAPASNIFFIGSNREAENTPSYIQSSICEITAITPISQLNIDGLIMSIVLGVNGTHTSP